MVYHIVLVNPVSANLYRVTRQLGDYNCHGHRWKKDDERLYAANGAVSWMNYMAERKMKEVKKRAHNLRVPRIILIEQPLILPCDSCDGPVGGGTPRRGPIGPQ